MPPFNKALFLYLQKAYTRAACLLIDTCDCESNEGVEEGKNRGQMVTRSQGSGFCVMCLVVIVAVLDVFLKKKNTGLLLDRN